MCARIISFIALIALVSCSSASSGTVTPAEVTKVVMPTPTLAEGSLVEINFASKVLGSALDYAVYLPAGYETSRLRYPVIYLLHGRGDNFASWARAKYLCRATGA